MASLLRRHLAGSHGGILVALFSWLVLGAGLLLSRLLFGLTFLRLWLGVLLSLLLLLLLLILG